MHTLDEQHHKGPWDAIQWISNKRDWQTVDQAVQGMTGIFDNKDQADHRKARDTLKKLAAKNLIETKTVQNPSGGRGILMFKRAESAPKPS